MEIHRLLGSTGEGDTTYGTNTTYENIEIVEYPERVKMHWVPAEWGYREASWTTNTPASGHYCNDKCHTVFVSRTDPKELLKQIHDALIAYEDVDVGTTGFSLVGDMDQWQKWLAQVCLAIGCEENLDND